MNPASPLRGQSKAAIIADEIELLIHRDGLDAGDRLGTKEFLQQSFGVARATVNEAVKLLHERGRLVAKSGPGGGLFIAVPDSALQMGRFLLAVGSDVQRVSDAMGLRNHLEYLIVRHAVEHRTEEDIAELSAIAERMARTREDPAGHMACVWDLHRRIAEITPNQALSSTYLGVVTFIRHNVAGRSTTDEFTRFFTRRLAAHQRLVEVIAVGDVGQVDDAVREHNEN